MHLDTLINCVAESAQALFAKIQAGEPLPALGLRRSARLPVLAAIYKELQRPILLLTDRTDRALTLAEELSLWYPSLNYQHFPEPTPLFYEDAAWGETTRRDRLLSLTALAAYHIPGARVPENPPLIIAPVRALMTRTLPRRDFMKSTLTIKDGQIYQFEGLVRSCVALGYESVNAVISPGQFARRGGILDLWPPAESQPVRLEFFGDEIETTRRFDPTTQRTTSKPKNNGSEPVLVTSAREYLIPEDLLSADSEIEHSEFHIPVLHKNAASIFDYLSNNALVVIDDKQAFEDTINEVEEGAINLRRENIAEGILPEHFPIPYLTWTEIQDSLSTHQSLVLGTPSPSEIDLNISDSILQDQTISLLSDNFTLGPRFGGHLKHVLEYLSDLVTNGDHQIVVSRQSARLEELWIEQKIQSENGVLDFIEGSLTEGWIFNPPGCSPVHLLTDGEIFGWRRPELRRRARPIVEAPEAGYTDFLSGDWVVHVDHGIGRFVGLVQRNVDGLEREYLCIEYANEAQLYVPVHQADRLTRYVGTNRRSPTPSRLGGTEWRKTRTRVKEAVQEVAKDLLILYAQRSMVQGFSFNPDTTWQQELEASFPYIETEDQTRALVEVKNDMQSDQPMDRLICGDVGYGKTEVALRAAFKAVLDGKQVAVLVPTTVLAQQHFNTFRQRLAAFPVVIEMLSRFRTPQQQRDILSHLSSGRIDILIGTHRLFSSDVEFKDLGLLIIDEEQRFGVTHKETLKKMRTEVDVLTLTATPIPRTLYLALSGIRDISAINTPPEERLPIVTHVGPYSTRLIRQAILRELERGGQVFFVHNRVQTIGAMKSHLNHLVPEAHISIAHGQMPELELSKRMEQFTEGEVDVLLSTSIIESGLDIPNANTLIVDRADTFGLAQLYQLRGRVGRGAQRAYAYFFRHNRQTPTPEGRQRLETIAENTQLGAGFSIAMRDLEIRGTGDILGTRQHGHVAAVGFYLYTRLLAEAVKRLHLGQNIPTPILSSTGYPSFSFVNVDLPMAISLPVDYVPDKNVRLGLYRRMADLRTLEEVEALIEEFNDRFGSPPETVHNLFYQLKIKLLSERDGLSSLTVENGQLVMRFPGDEIPASLPDLGPKVRIGKTALWMPYKSLPDWQNELVNVLLALQSNNVNVN